MHVCLSAYQFGPYIPMRLFVCVNLAVGVCLSVSLRICVFVGPSLHVSAVYVSRAHLCVFYLVCVSLCQYTSMCTFVYPRMVTGKLVFESTSSVSLSYVILPILRIQCALHFKLVLPMCFYCYLKCPICVTLQTMDVNGDGFVDRAELTQILHAAFDSVEDWHVDEIFDEADVDGRGKISYGMHISIILISVVFMSTASVLDEFAQFCVKRPEYAVLFQAQGLNSDTSDTTTARSHLKAD